MKNNKELKETLSETLDKIQEMQNRQFIQEFYINGDIKTFIKQAENITAEVGIIGNDGKEATEKQTKMIHLWGKFKLLQCLFETKKFMNSKKDITYIGKLLLEMAEECNELGSMK